jgi:hypothetical protein
MARLTPEEKADFVRLASGPVQLQAPPPQVPFEVYLRRIEALARLPRPPRPLGMKGTQWKL